MGVSPLRNFRSSIVLLAALALLVTGGPGSALGASGTTSATPATSAKFTTSGNYIVQMSGDPAVAYEGGIRGLKATAPKAGAKINPFATDVVKYTSYLKGNHDAALKAVGATQKLYDYTFSYDGFAARLTAAQANALAARKDVVSVVPDALHEVDTSSTPTFLGLDAEGGLWDQLGGVGSAGEDIVIGVVDSGIWPESLSFTDRVDANGVPSNAPGAKRAFQQLPGWHGKCVNGEQFVATLCNQKLIGAQFFNAGWADAEAGLSGSEVLNRDRPWEFLSARDYNGHGTHTSSTAGGNFGVPATGAAALFGSISGMAPRARVAMYKALWSTEDAATAGGNTTDLVAAIDQAVADGVDVINYSISGTSTNFLDPVEVSFLFAADAGIFVAESAGNSGPTVSTVAHPGPWTTTVAAGTHNRSGTGSVTLGNGSTYNGASLTPGVGPAPLINATAAGLPGADPNLLRQCFSAGAAGALTTSGDPAPQLDPALVAGKIVVCERGGAAPANARVDKSLAVQQAGGVGVVIWNVAVSSLNADLHSIPTVHINNVDGAAVAAYAATAGATATIAQAVVVLNAPAPFTASFSSRGPLIAGGGDLLKPDVIAPGQDILASVAPPGNAGKDFNIYSGTSMSSPHVAGLAALLKDLHPDWSPMAIKSALMTSASDVLDGPNTNPLVIFRQGAGHVAPNSAADPGLVYDAGFDDWRGFLRSQKLCTFCFGATPAPVFDTSDYNTASIAIGDLAGSQTVFRSVTNVDDSAATYTASLTGLAGVDAVISPTSLQLDPGETGTFTVAFTRTTATANAYVGGQLSWSDGSHDVRIPVVVRPVALAAPLQVSGTGGPISYDVRFGYDGPFAADPRGLIAATTETRTVTDDPTDGTCSLTSPNAQIHEVAIPAGTTYARFSLFDAFTDGNDDLDMCVFNAAGTNVGSSGSGTSAEEVNLLNPAAGTYRVVVQGWGTDGPDAVYTLFWWALGSADAGNMTVTEPAVAVLGSSGTVNLTFSGLAPATKYLGSVVYSGTTGLPNPTIVRVDTP
jgi:subtilisin family serine protease